MLADVAIGLSALIATFILAMAMGGFSFFEPWALRTCVSLFVAGLSRAKEADEKFWLRVACVNSCWFLMSPFLLHGPWWWEALVIAGTAVPTAAGLLVRRALGRYANRRTA